MRRIRVSTLALVLALGLGTAAATAAFAHGWQGQGSAQGYDQGMMQPGYGGPQQGGPGYGMGGQGMMRPGYGGHWQGGPGYGMGGQGGPGFGRMVLPGKDISSDDVRHFLEHRLTAQGNKRLQIGKVEEQDKDTVVAEIQTVDGALVERLKINRHTGAMEQAE